MKSRFMRSVGLFSAVADPLIPLRVTQEGGKQPPKENIDELGPPALSSPPQIK